jgi:hypothetical protein
MRGARGSTYWILVLRKFPSTEWERAQTAYTDRLQEEAGEAQEDELKRCLESWTFFRVAM